MKHLREIRNAIITSAFGAIVLSGLAISVAAQDVNREYRQWQEAQAWAQRECQQSSWSRHDYNQCQAAQRRAQEQYQQYQRAANRNNGYYNSSYYNNGYYNNGYNTRSTYRIYRNGSYYSTDSRGAELLRTAIRNGYSQGYRQGQRDRRSNYGFNYGNSSLYRSGTYGYQSYVARDQYQYYFQQGFERGYQDGFYSRTQYGYRTGNSFNILGNVLNTILNLATN